ncbi:MAG: endonuclease/exonuclease/phosphatase family protein [Bacteroidales bacterium]|nr:endonuclease/exonuclease/phosphatase family protein [Bacteroidales bacterium]
MEIIANGREEWIGWVELAKETINEVSVNITARVIKEVNADIFAIVEAEDRPSLVTFNKEFLDNDYRHIMIIDGNDERGIDVGIMTRENFAINSIHSNVDTRDNTGIVFSRDCAQYEVATPGGNTVYVLVNHFKSQSGGGGDKRKRQAGEVRRIAERLVSENKHVVVLGDLNEGPKANSVMAENLKPLYENNSPLTDCYSLPGFDTGNRPGSFDSCGLSNRLDYIFISKSLENKFSGGKVFRKGLWGSRVTRPDMWEIYHEINESYEQASDHSALFIDLDI